MNLFTPLAFSLQTTIPMPSSKESVKLCANVRFILVCLVLSWTQGKAETTGAQIL